MLVTVEAIVNANVLDQLGQWTCAHCMQPIEEEGLDFLSHHPTVPAKKTVHAPSNTALKNHIPLFRPHLSFS